MTRGDLQKLALARILDAEVLLNARRYSGAYHFAGVAVECAIKACIAKQTKRFEFPDKPIADAAWKHDLNVLIKTAKLEILLDDTRKQSPAFAQNWSTIEKWRIESRYDPATTRRTASDLLLSVTQQTEGVLPWLQIYW